MLRKIKYLARCVFKSIVRTFIRFKKIDCPIIVMTLLVKNEVEIIEKNLNFHKSMGVDYFIVTDNNSTDGTIEILEKYKSIGWIKEVIYEKEDNYNQSKWVTRMVNIVKKDYSADWVINADADEFWYSKSGNLKNELSDNTSNVISCKIYNVIPSENIDFLESNLVVKKSIINPESYDLSKFNLYSKQFPKVIHRVNGFKSISTGNHSVKMNINVETETSNIVIYHYNYRSAQQFLNKMIQGGMAIEKNKSLSLETARHWRYFYNGWKNSTLNLEEEYKKAIGYNYLNDFIESGVLETDNSIRDFKNGGINEHDKKN